MSVPDRRGRRLARGREADGLREDLLNAPKNLVTYAPEEVDAILGRNIDRLHEGGRVSHDELLETAREIGMTTLEVEAAIAEQVKVRAEQIEREEARQRGVTRLLLHFVALAVLCAAFYILDTRLTGGVWYPWASLACGLAVAVSAARGFARKPGETPAAPVAMSKTAVEVRDGNKLKLKP